MAPLPTPPPGANPSVTVSVSVAEPPRGGSDPLPPEVARAVDGAAGAEPLTLSPEPDELPEASPALLDPALTPPPPEKDELADFAAAAAEVMASPAVGGGRPVAGVGRTVDLFGDDAAR